MGKMMRISAAERRSVEGALLRQLPTVALIAWRDVCEQRRDGADGASVWRYWQGQLVRVRSILEQRECPPPRDHGRDMPSVVAPSYAEHADDYTVPCRGCGRASTHTRPDTDGSAVPVCDDCIFTRPA